MLLDSDADNTKSGLSKRNVVCLNYDSVLIQPIIVFCLNHIFIISDSSPKNKDYHVIPDVSDFFSSGKHKQIFLVCLIQGTGPL